MRACVEPCFFFLFLTPAALSLCCQAVQEEGAGESGGALRVQRLRLSDGDDRPRQTAQLHSGRGEDPNT